MYFQIYPSPVWNVPNVEIREGFTVEYPFEELSRTL
jgi:hypothetical protein